ncbi:YceH family protein [Oceanimonas smirnovii]|uniref:YceH family protein n=1 Tax=Oceanimonas smirnovii TaxID=264574 RepID=UPI003FD39EA6
MEKLSALEQRVVGCLIEKQVSTPDVYPLTLNSLINACNQKSNRDPVMSLSEGDVQSVLNNLVARRLVNNVAGFNARAAKYQHRFCNTEFGELHFNDGELAIICELLLRGPQTPGELRSRCARLHQFGDVSEVDACLHSLMEKGPYVVKLARLPGKREARYAHLFGDVPVADAGAPAAAVSAAENSAARIQELEAEVERLKARIKELEAQL